MHRILRFQSTLDGCAFFCFVSTICRYSDIADWMEELGKIEVDTETKTERWLELAEIQ